MRELLLGINDMQTMGKEFMTTILVHAMKFATFKNMIANNHQISALQT
jgi:hypothetical protein